MLECLDALHQPLDPPGCSVLLRELASVSHVPDATLSPGATPLLHALASAHAYIMMFVHVCRMGQVSLVGSERDSAMLPLETASIEASIFIKKQDKK